MVMVLETLFRWYHRWRWLAIALCLSGMLCGFYFNWLYDSYYYTYDNRVWRDPDVRRRVMRIIERDLIEELELDKGTGCQFPELDPFAWEATQLDKTYDPVKCEGQDWIECYHSTCRLVNSIKTNVTDVICSYRDILYRNDYVYKFGHATRVRGGEYKLKASDHVKVTCTGTLRGWSVRWSGIKAGYRPVTPLPSPPGRENTFNILMFGFDSAARTSFIRMMPKSWVALKELGATVMQGYNIIGSGTFAALTPILTGRTALELPEVRKGFGSNYTVDSFPLLFYNLKQDGYRTAYFEDSPRQGTFQRRANGFRRQPVDHYFRAFSLENLARSKRFWTRPSSEYCVGDTPQFKLLINMTKQFLELDGKRFIFTFISDISHDDFNYIQWADDDTTAFLRGLNEYLEDTLIIVMGDHGSRRPYRVPGANWPRGLTMLEEIPRNRSCSEAGIEPHWCSCLIWENVSTADPIYNRTGIALVQYINELLYGIRSRCAPRTLTSIDGVLRQQINSRLEKFRHYDDNYDLKPLSKKRYQVKIEAGPGRGIFEATMTYTVEYGNFTVNERDISRINAYKDEPHCITRLYPHLAPFCYCH